MTAKLEERLAHALMADDERQELRDRVLELRQRLFGGWVRGCAILRSGHESGSFRGPEPGRALTLPGSLFSY
jgi:hypothetical protein